MRDSLRRALIVARVGLWLQQRRILLTRLRAGRDRHASGGRRWVERVEQVVDLADQLDVQSVLYPDALRNTKVELRFGRTSSAVDRRAGADVFDGRLA